MSNSVADCGQIVAKQNGEPGSAANAVTKQRILTYLVTYAFLLVVLSRLLPAGDRVVDYVVGLPVLILAVVWCHFDAKGRGLVLRPLMKFCLIFLFVIAFPIYVFQTQGVRGFKTLNFTAISIAAGAALLLRYF